MNKFRTSNNTVMVDILFILLMVFLYVSGTAVPWMNPIARQGEVTPPVLMMVEMTWDDDSQKDIDLWVRPPNTKRIGFTNKDIGFGALERDDTGWASDTYVVNNEERTVRRNYEVITFTQLPSGEYVVNGHYYSIQGEPLEVKIKITMLGPFKEVYTGTIVLTPRQEKTFISFVIDKDGNVVDLNDKVNIPIKFPGTGP